MAPVAVSAAPMPFEEKFARMAMHARLQITDAYIPAGGHGRYTET